MNILTRPNTYGKRQNIMKKLTLKIQNIKNYINYYQKHLIMPEEERIFLL